MPASPANRSKAVDCVATVESVVESMDIRSALLCSALLRVVREQIALTDLLNNADLPHYIPHVKSKESRRSWLFRRGGPRTKLADRAGQLGGAALGEDRAKHGAIDQVADDPPDKDAPIGRDDAQQRHVDAWQ